jgi:hypothetical protein
VIWFAAARNTGNQFRAFGFTRDLQDRLGILALSAPFRIRKLQIRLAVQGTDPVSDWQMMFELERISSANVLSRHNSQIRASSATGRIRFEELPVELIPNQSSGNLSVELLQFESTRDGSWPLTLRRSVDVSGESCSHANQDFCTMRQ